MYFYTNSWSSFNKNEPKLDPLGGIPAILSKNNGIIRTEKRYLRGPFEKRA